MCYLEIRQLFGGLVIHHTASLFHGLRDFIVASLKEYDIQYAALQS